jgi:hypothetical protein
MKFTGTKDYVATDDLKVAVNASIVLERPLLIKGEPGTGKTVLAEEVAKALGAPLLTWHIKSTTKAQQGLYEYDAVSRLRDSQLGDARVSDISNYIKRGKLWEAFTHDKRPVLLIDEIDKADIEFPNDLLLELDRMEFFVYETGENIKASLRPIVMITSNSARRSRICRSAAATCSAVIASASWARRRSAHWRPCAAARLSHAYPWTRSRGTPTPSAYIRPRLSSSLPCSTALRYSSAAVARSCRTPSPERYNPARAVCATGSPCAASAPEMRTVSP